MKRQIIIDDLPIECLELMDTLSPYYSMNFHHHLNQNQCDIDHVAWSKINFRLFNFKQDATNKNFNLQ